MNPHFSASVGRTKTGNSDFGFRHVEAALLRLNPDGKLIALLDADACLKTNKGKIFWHRIATHYEARAFLILPRAVFYKYGTTFQTVAVIIQKPENIQQRHLSKQKIFEFGNLSEILAFRDSFDPDNL
jgi:hypothetical protein